MQRLIIVSSRTPILLQPDHSSWRDERACNSVSAALDAVLSRHPGVWIGWPAAQASDQAELERLADRHFPYPLGFVLPPQQLYTQYIGFSDGILWPHLHSMADKASRTFIESGWQAYVAVNELYAKRAYSALMGSDIVWVHDYRLMLVPRILRELGFSGRIGYFHHVAFPEPSAVQVIPHAREMLESLCCADVLAFQTPHYRDNFLNATVRLARVQRESERHRIHFDGRWCRAGVVPIGVNVAQLQSTMNPPADSLSQWLSSPYKLIGADRLDYIKGVPAKIQAVGKFLERFPGFVGHVCLLQFLQRVRTGLAAYGEEYALMSAAVTEVNNRFGSASWQPVHIEWDASRSSIAAAYARADAGVVTPFSDGMNLVAKEYVAAGPSDGVLVLSRFAGAARQLGKWAVLTNPFDTNDLAGCIHRAVAMEQQERRSRKAHLLGNVTHEDIVWWIDRNLDLLRECRDDAVA